MSILLTAGHSATDPGAIGVGGRTEASVVTELRDLVAYKLRNDHGKTVFTDGDKGVNKALNVALSMFSNKKIRIEFHCNASSNSSANGTETISLGNLMAESKLLSSATSLVLGTRLRGVDGWISQEQSHRGKLAYVSNGGIILELFFITNEAELKAYDAKKWLLATSLAKTIAQFD